jgi:hypothetical protein
MEQVMKSHRTTTWIAIAGLLLVSAPAAFASDGKMISSAICQPMSPWGVEHVWHNGSSLQAQGGAVTVICPIVKDSIGADLNWVDVRHLRPPNGAGQVVTGRVYSCNATYGGCFASSLSQSSSSNTYTSVHVTSNGLPNASDDYFYYRSDLPEDWKIASVEYNEDT